jgi:hypothetical protein
VRYIKRDCGDIGFHISHSLDNPMALVIGKGVWKGTIFPETEIEFPIEDVEQNVRIYLKDDPEEPVVVVRGRNYTDPPEGENVVLTLCNFYIPPNCTDLRELPIYTRRFDGEYSTPFGEDGEVQWEKLE